MITLYDIPASTTADGTFSPYVWRARYALHVKGLAYKVVWVEYADVASTMQKIGAPPTGVRDGQDPLHLSDSLEIVQYLDTHYPATQQLLPPHSRALQLALLDTFVATRVRLPTVYLVVLNMAKEQRPESEAFFRRTREEASGKPWEEIARGVEVRAGLVQDLVDNMEVLGKWKGSDTFLGGSEVSFADVVVAAWLKCLMDLGKPGEGDTIFGAIKGKWGEFLAAFKKWDVISAVTQ
ncbi:hypothetical protein FA95DRAFT_1603084 [Auriscalpium vulgare]|uniref:Uncharacterized protein n=1 Tax=Auriscalpium vulgare TaxID=40419 RepID=A0ACB8S4E7_9AGAM|nr:hypothetical protein FA95DRAFT_1603084 [Auriscalpium vulgare]